MDNFRNYVARGHYDLTIFHQVLKGSLQIVLGGGYTADLKEKAALTPIRNEAHNGLKNRRGTIAMARRANDEDSATCQFFINIADNDVLNFKARTAGRLRLLRLRRSDRRNGCPRSDCEDAGSRHREILGPAGGAGRDQVDSAG